MKVELICLDDDFYLKVVNEDGLIVEIDGFFFIGGYNKVFWLMQMLLVFLGSCSVIDVIYLLCKQWQELWDIKVMVIGEWDIIKILFFFIVIYVYYMFYGNIVDNKVEWVVSMFMEKFCFVKIMLEKVVEIIWSWEKVD